MTGAVISYARAFGGNNGVLVLPRHLTTFRRKELTAQHKELLFTRRKLYAHVDVVGKDEWALNTPPFKTRVSFRKSPSGKVEIVPIVDVPDISPGSLRIIAELIEFQLQRVLGEMSATLRGMAEGRTYIFETTYTVGLDFP